MNYILIFQYLVTNKLLLTVKLSEYTNNLLKILLFN